MHEISLPNRSPTDGAITLRPWSETDVPAVAAACQDPEIPRWVPIPWPYAERDAREWIAGQPGRRAAGEAVEFAVVDATTGELLGSIGLNEFDWDNRRASVGYWVVANHRRKGVATRALRLISGWALDVLSLGRLQLNPYLGNIVSERVAERAGFVKEGVLRSYVESRGERLDVTAFSLVAGTRTNSGGHRA